ncbi:MAG: protein kinase [Anaerolineae bacterium]|nr:protein kinase [Anaerolineae bacterium]
MTLTNQTLLEGRYRIEAVLAQGGMGTVYRGFDINLETPVAIKENFFQTREAITQFKKEALILARLRHPSLPRVTHHFSVGNRQYLVMDYVEGADLWQIIQNQGHPLNEQEALTYISQICDALAYLHGQSPPIIHRDVKPQNIKITPDGRAILVDFGIAKEQISGEKTMTGARGVTPGFSPPEQYSGGTGPTSDIYSLGATLYALLTGAPPPDSISLLVKNQKFTPVTQINPTITPALSEAITWAMELETTQRPPDLPTWQQRLRAVQARGGEATWISPQEKSTLTGPKEFWLVDEQGNKYPLRPEKRLTIGRSSTNAIKLSSPQVSRHHATVALVGQRCLVYDAGSANGTFVNGRKVDRRGLEFGADDTLTIGPNQFRLAGSPAARPSSTSAPAQPIPPPSAVPPPSLSSSISTGTAENQLGGLAGMTQMLTINIAKKVEAMSNTQVAILAVALIGGLVLATYLVGGFIRDNVPWLWQLFPFYYVAGPLAYVLSRRKGTAILIHAPTHVLVLSIAWYNPPYLALILSGLASGATMEGSFIVPRLPDWLRYPLGLILAYAVSLLVLTFLVSASYNYLEFFGVALIGVAVYLISEIQKGVLQARLMLRK